MPGDVRDVVKRSLYIVVVVVVVVAFRYVASPMRLVQCCAVQAAVDRNFRRQDEIARRPGVRNGEARPTNQV